MANLSFEQSKHLVVRTGFGPELEKIYRYQSMASDQAINHLLTLSTDYLIQPPKLNSVDVFRRLRRAKNTQRLNKLFRQDGNKFRRWGLQQAINNPNALQERMTWFWHNHFTSSIRNSRRTLNLMLDQDLLIRKQALGNFAELLKSMAYDPMMLIFLDGLANKKGKPNENFARELLELFTLGEGHYTEKDIVEVARAFTGWTINGKTQRARLNKKQFDQTPKTIFNQTGKFTSDDVLAMLLAHPRTAEFIAEKFWKEFISLDEPNSRYTKDWAEQFRRSNYDIKTLLKAVFSSDVFWAAQNRGQLIKSPLELAVGALRSLDLEDKNLPAASIVTDLVRMGQNLYTPPNVKGWPGGAEWINDSTLPARQQFLRKLVRGSGTRQEQQPEMTMMGAEMSMTMQAKAPKNAMPTMDMPSLPMDQWASWLLPIPAVTPINQASPRARLQAILLDPAYQLK